VIDRHGNFNCYAYAFGLSKHPDFALLVYRTQKTAVMDSAFVAEQLARGRLTEIDAFLMADQRTRRLSEKQPLSLF
jgi:hypothetical protein